MTGSGLVLLEGGVRFGGQILEPDRQALEMAGGLSASAAILLAAAAPDRKDQRAGTLSSAAISLRNSHPFVIGL